MTTALDPLTRSRLSAASPVSVSGPSPSRQEPS